MSYAMHQMYARHNNLKFDRLERDLKSMDPALLALIPGTAQKLKDVRSRLERNQEFLNLIVAERRVFYNNEHDYEKLLSKPRPVVGERASKVRSTLRQCVRDWSQEGAEERALCYGPILSELERLHPDADKRGNIRVLVPGSGLGACVRA